MPSDNNSPPNATPPVQKVKEVSNMTALAMELPFTLVGAIAIGVLLGFYLDKWLHTKPVLTLLLGALGFIAGVREVIRRLPGSSDGPSSN